MTRKLTVLLIPLLIASWHFTQALTTSRRFHPDEAFYMTFARHAAVGGDWMLSGSLDKPPLTIYANALILSLVAVDPLPDGVLTLDVHKGEFAGKLLAWGFGLVLVAVVMQMTYRGCHHLGLASLSGGLLAVSPLFASYSTSAFMDIPMLALSLLALWLMHSRKPLWSGVCLILALGAKPQAIFFVPLVGLLAFGDRRSWRSLIPLAIGAGMLWLWDSVRVGDSVFVLGSANNLREAEALGLAWWLGQLWQSSWWAVAGIALLGIMHPIGRWLGLWCVAYLTFHLVAPIAFYTRYVLLLLPMLAMLASLGVAFVLAKHPTRLVRWGVIALSGLMLFTVSNGTTDLSHNGLQHVSQMDEVAMYLNNKPVATVIYDHWFGWELGYYMGEWTDKRRVYHPTAHAMVSDALALAETGTRYFIVPTDTLSKYGFSSVESEDTLHWLEAFRQAGFGVIREAQFAGVDIYALTPP